MKDQVLALGYQNENLDYIYISSVYSCAIHWYDLALSFSFWYYLFLQWELDCTLDVQISPLNFAIIFY